MKSNRSLLVLAVVFAVSMPSLALAQAYKCRQPDGSLSFQGQPCAPGSVGSQVSLKPAAGAYAEPAPDPRRTLRGSTPKVIAPPVAPVDIQRQLADEQIKSQNEKILAYNRNLRCNRARQQLGVLKGSRPAYSFDNKGDRTYVKDDDRAAQAAAAERKVAEECT